MRLRFTKMHGLGNDFVLIDAISQRVKLTDKQIRKLADRRFGVGCDQVLLVEPPQHPKMDFRYRIFNEDGSEVENCGNGARCLAKFVRERRLIGKSSIAVETCNGAMTLNIQKDGQITVDMGAPQLNPKDIPFLTQQQQLTYSLPLRNTTIEIAAVSMGNPHAVILVDDVSVAPVATQGPEIETHPQFPQGVNVGFMEILSRDDINLRVFERGVGETLACGTGACAAVVAGQLQNLLSRKVTVNLPGGSLSVEWQGEDTPVIMTGPAETVFNGQIKL